MVMPLWYTPPGEDRRYFDVSHAAGWAAAIPMVSIGVSFAVIAAALYASHHHPAAWQAMAAAAAPVEDFFSFVPIVSEIPAELVALGLEERADFARFAYAVSWGIGSLFALTAALYLLLAVFVTLFLPIAVFPKQSFDRENIRVKDYLVPFWVFFGMQFFPLVSISVFWYPDFDPNGSWRDNRVNVDDFDYFRVAIFFNGAVCFSSFLLIFKISYLRLRLFPMDGAILFHRVRRRKDLPCSGARAPRRSSIGHG